MRGHRDVERRQSEQNRWQMALDRVEDRSRFGPTGHQHHGGTGGERKRQRISKAVRKENLRHRKHDIVRIDAQHPATVSEPRVERVVLKMNDAFRPACRAGAVHPERHRVAVRVGGRELARLLGDPFVPMMLNRPRHTAFIGEVRRELLIVEGIRDLHRLGVSVVEV